MLKVVFFLALAVNVSLLYSLLSVIWIDCTDDLSQFLFLLERLRGTFMSKNCGANWANWKIEIAKTEKMHRPTSTEHTERFVFYSIWFINESTIFKIFETRQ